MSHNNFGGLPLIGNSSLPQPYSGYSNGSIAYQDHQANNSQRVQKVESGGATSQPQHRSIDTPNRQRPNGFHENAAVRSAPATQDYQQQQPPQRLLQNTLYQDIERALPADVHTNAFWNLRAELRLPDGQSAEGTFAGLYLRYPTARDEIWRHHSVQLAQQVQTFQQAASTRVTAAQAIPGATRVTKSTKAQGKRPKSTAVSRNSIRPAASGTAINLPPIYVADDDLDTPQKCRDYLAYIDAADVHALEFENDDWEDVRENRKHDFIGEMFEALTHPYAQDPPTGITMTKDASEKYNRQQDKQTARVLGLLQTAPQIKAAKALCSLLFDAAVYVHEVGVPKELYDGYLWYTRKERQVDRKYRLDLESICSERLDKIVTGIKQNKLVAMDVLEQTNLHRMARDPGFYLAEKFAYLRSNKARQENIDRHNKQDEEDAHFAASMGTMAAPNMQLGVKQRMEAVERGIAEVGDQDEIDADEDSEYEHEEGIEDFSEEQFARALKLMRR